ncbi:Superfamily II DNA and RNA helicase [bacterium A37T11]|nr:Superfamily II DNA and RNA helicase [bacterium A37T11]
MTFNDFNFDERLFEGLSSMGYREPTPIQAQTIPLIQAHHDLIACAQTGTGKTASYLLPVMDAICRNENRPTISALILAPTRELAVQIDQQVEGMAYFTGLSSIAIYGGGDGIGYEQQRKALREGVDIVIATPGRLIAHISSGIVRLGEIQYLVLDEADRMLDMGFKDDILRIVGQLPEKRQTLLFSATMPPKIRSFASKLLQNPEQVNIAISQPAAGILQQCYRVADEQKNALILHILKNGSYNSIIIFASTKESVKKLDRELRAAGLKVKPFHSDLTQDEREQILLSFKNRQLSTLVGTDVLSRGIDVEGIDLVVNYNVPLDPEDYIHRIGRTARAEKTGTAVTFINNKDARKFLAIERMMERKVDLVPLPPEIGESPILAEGALEREHGRGEGGRDHHGRSNNAGHKKRFFKGKKRPSGSGNATKAS